MSLFDEQLNILLRLHARSVSADSRALDDNRGSSWVHASKMEEEYESARKLFIDTYKPKDQK